MAEIPTAWVTLGDAVRHGWVPFRSASYVAQLLSARVRRVQRVFTADANDAVPPFKKQGREWQIWGPTLAAWINSRERRLPDVSPVISRRGAARSLGAIFTDLG